MHDFIQTSEFTHHYFLLIIPSLIIIGSIFTIIWFFIDKKYNELEIPCMMIGSTLILFSCIFISVVYEPYAEYTGTFKVTDSTTDRIHQNDEPKIIIQDKHKNEQILPITENKVFHKGDTVKVKIYANKNTKPSLANEISLEYNAPSSLCHQKLKSIEKN